MMRGAGLFLLGPLIAGSALASGYIPGFETRETLGSHAECVARLAAAAGQAAAAVEPKTGRADGSTREVTLEPITQGVERANAHQAHYRAKLWYAHGRPRDDIGRMEYSASWQETNLTCDGKVLITHNSQGYTSSAFGPLETPPAPQAP